MPISIEIAGFAAIALCALGFLVWTERKHAGEIERKDKLIADLMDRLMSRDVGEYTAVRAERLAPERTKTPEYYETEAENLIAFQTMGEEWKDPEKWMKDYQDEIARAGKDSA